MSREELFNGKEIKDIGVFREIKFGGVALRMSLENFHKEGFKYGDSIDMIFSNGDELIDIPYYDNYYSPFDTPMLCGFPSFTEPRLSYNMTRDAWYVHHLDESCSVTIRLNRPEGFIDIQNMMQMRTSNDVKAHESEKAFANFREVRGGRIKEKILYRTASICDLEHARNEYSDRFAAEAGIRFAISLSDSKEEMDKYVLDDSIRSPHFKNLHQAGCITSANIGVNYREPRNRAGIAYAMKELIKHEGPYLVYCSLGKDRTGFICTLLQSLCGASYEEIETEYMKTFSNLYRFDKASNPEKYQAVVDMYLKDMLVIICAADSSYGIESRDFARGARGYLQECGMSSTEIDRLVECLK